MKFDFLSTAANIHQYAINISYSNKNYYLEKKNYNFVRFFFSIPGWTEAVYY